VNEGKAPGMLNAPVGCEFNSEVPVVVPLNRLKPVVELPLDCDGPVVLPANGELPKPVGFEARPGFWNGRLPFTPVLLPIPGPPSIDARNGLPPVACG